MSWIHNAKNTVIGRSTIDGKDACFTLKIQCHFWNKPHTNDQIENLHCLGSGKLYLRLQMVYCIQIITVRWTAHAIMIEHGIFKIFLFLLLFSISCFMDMTNFLAKKWASTIIILNKINAHHQSGKKNQLTTQNQTDCTRSSEIEHWTRTDTILYNSCSTLHLLACFK